MAPGAGKAGARAAPVARGGQVAALIGCFATLLGNTAVAGEQLDGSALPGSKDFCVTLQSISISVGQMTPSFDGEREDYTVEVNNANAKALVLSLGLQLQKYNLRHTPLILVDGKKLDYVPMNIISTKIPLNQTVGPYDRTTIIDVQDPTQGNWLSHYNKKQYRFHIKQPPEYGVVAAEAIEVKAPGGKDIKSDPPFSPTATSSDYYFNVTSKQTSVSVRFLCSRFSTRTIWESRTMRRGEWMTVDLSGQPTKTISVSCIFDDPKWTKAEDRRTYLLLFVRDLRLGDKTVMPLMLPDKGYCVHRRTYDAQVSNSSLRRALPQDEAEGFVCLTDEPHPDLMVKSEELQANIVLFSHESHFQIEMQNYVPVKVPHAHQRHRFVLKVTLGNDHREFPVHFIWPQACSTMFCPTHYALKKNIDRQVHAEKRLCLSEECTVESDTERCCDRLASCDAYKCSGRTMPKTTMDCQATTCSQADEEHCCHDHEMCSDLDCPINYTLRRDAVSVYCKEKSCTKHDRETCCIKRASCSGYTCALHGEEPPKDKANRHCRWNKCSRADDPHCCGDVASCKEYHCPIGFAKRPGAETLFCFGSVCEESDANTCCQKSLGSNGHLLVMQVAATVEMINPDGTYAVKFDDGTVDNSVPEWALHSNSTNMTFRPHQTVTVAMAQDGYHRHHDCSGWVTAVHPDGTYSIAFDNGQSVNNVPGWAVRAVDHEGNRYVTTAALAKGQRVYAGRTRDGRFKRLASLMGQVTSVNPDGTFTIQYISGSTEEHVPLWDLRLVDSHGKSHVRPNFEVGQVVEVNMNEKRIEEEFKPRQQDELRTKFLFGIINKVNPDNTYGVQYDYGDMQEQNVPLWAIRALDLKGQSFRKDTFKMGDRVEARLSLPNAQHIKIQGIAQLGIAVREKLNLYEGMNCWPIPRKCAPRVAPGPGDKSNTPQLIPELDGYDVVRNPEGRKLCYYDASCSYKREVGCNAENKVMNCRYCGFGDNPPCPKPFDCRDKFSSREWPPEQKEYCCKAFNLGCPFVCRFGKWWPDEAKGWGPWWTPRKRAWCCENQQIGCPRLEHKPLIVSTRPPPSTSAGASKCPNSKGVKGYGYSHAGYWSGGAKYRGTHSLVQLCARECDKFSGCIAFSWHKKRYKCYIYQEATGRVADSSQEAFHKCSTAQMLGIQVKYTGARQNLQHPNNMPSTEFSMGLVATAVPHAVEFQTADRLALALGGMGLSVILCWSLRLRWACRSSLAPANVVAAMEMQPTAEEDLWPLLS